MTAFRPTTSTRDLGIAPVIPLRRPAPATTTGHAANRLEAAFAARLAHDPSIPTGAAPASRRIFSY